MTTDARKDAINTLIGNDYMICADRCVGQCDCPGETIEALLALGVTQEEIDNR